MKSGLRLAARGRQGPGEDMLDPVAFICAPTKCSQSRNPRGLDCGFCLPSPLPQPLSCEPKVYKVLVCDHPSGEAKGTRTPALDQSRGCALPSSPLRLGNSCSPGQQETGKGSLQHGVLGGEWGLGQFLHPYEGRWASWRRGKPQRIGQPLRRLFLRTWRPARVAISNTSRTPSLVLAEHSR